MIKGSYIAECGYLRYTWQDGVQKDVKSFRQSLDNLSRRE